MVLIVCVCSLFVSPADDIKMQEALEQLHMLQDSELSDKKIKKIFLKHANWILKYGDAVQFQAMVQDENPYVKSVGQLGQSKVAFQASRLVGGDELEATYTKESGKKGFESYNNFGTEKGLKELLKATIEGLLAQRTLEKKNH